MNDFFVDENLFFDTFCDDLVTWLEFNSGEVIRLLLHVIVVQKYMHYYRLFARNLSSLTAKKGKGGRDYVRTRLPLA